ncbi:MAG: RNA methyltransferase, partial [Deltaproteobacteria bacterium]|nr:RNA methyltransferase [Deltaproteobacteria bacterium]
EKVVLLCGPEGGFEDSEIDEALVRGFTCVSLGGNILRAETAPVIAVGIVRYEMG